MLTKETKRWLRAIEIARVLFEVEGYHALYLNQIDEFIRRKTMYCPKIKEEFIPILYRMAKEQRKPMTKLVNQIIERAIKENGGGPDESTASSQSNSGNV